MNKVTYSTSEADDSTVGMSVLTQYWTVNEQMVFDTGAVMKPPALERAQ